MPETSVPVEKFSEFILPENYVQFSPLNSEIAVHDSLRGIAFDKGFLQGLLSFVTVQNPKKSGAILYRIGYQWGQEVYVKIEDLALLTFPEVRSIKDLSMNQFHQLFTNYLAALGWGNFELKRRDDFLFVDLYNSIMVDAVKTGNKAAPVDTACELYAGFFAGIFGRISNMELACVEITCKTEGYEWCSFLLDNEDTVNMIHKHIRQNFSPLEAFQKVKKEIEED
jgi:predicted hydrocarbon binding protein